MTQRVELIELGKKICLILSKQGEIGIRLHSSYQGGGNATLLKIVASHGDEKFLRAAKKFLTETLHLSLTYEPHHGKGGKNNTLLVPLFGIKEVSIEAINSLSQGIIKKEGSNGKCNKGKVEQHENEKPTEKIVGNSVPVVKREMSDISKYRRSLSRYLRPIMEMEGVDSRQFPFDKEGQDSDVITIRCQNENISQMIERAISYISESSVVSDGSVLIIDCSKFILATHKFFAFPPRRGQGIEVVKEKIKKVYPSNPVVSETESGFIVSFVKRNSYVKAHKVFIGLNWEAIINEDHSILLRYEEGTEVADFVENPPASVVMSESSHDEDILEELKSLSQSSNLSPETMKRIERALMNSLKKSNPEEYAKILLEKLGY